MTTQEQNTIARLARRASRILVREGRQSGAFRQADRNLGEACAASIHARKGNAHPRVRTAPPARRTRTLADELKELAMLRAYRLPLPASQPVLLIDETPAPNRVTDGGRVLRRIGGAL